MKPREPRLKPSMEWAIYVVSVMNKKDADERDMYTRLKEWMDNNCKYTGGEK